MGPWRVGTFSNVDILDGLEVASEKTMHSIVREFTDDGVEVVVEVGK